MNGETYHPESRPCPECGGPRVLQEKLGPEVAAYSAEAARAWDQLRKGGTFNSYRCLQCGHIAFFFKPQPPKPPKR